MKKNLKIAGDRARSVWPDRLVKLFLTLLLTAGLLSGCAPANTDPSSRAKSSDRNGEVLTRYERVFTDYFDTVTTIILYADSAEEAEAAFNLAEERLRNYHRAFDIYHTYPGRVNIKSLNDRAGQGPVRVEPLVLELLQQAKRANELSHGAANPALGPVIRVWKEAVNKIGEAQEKGESGDYFLPAQDQLEALNRHTDFGQVLLDGKAGTVELKDPEMALDVGSGSKGLAAEKLAADLKQAGIKMAMLSLGGNVRTIGTKGDGSPWLIGVQNPQAFLPQTAGAEPSVDEGEATGSNAPNGWTKASELGGRTGQGDLVLAVKAVDCAVVTSGRYMRFVAVGDKVYHHIIDPDTLRPESRYDSVTVICPDAGLADSLTTALFNLPLAAGLDLAEQLENFEVLWVKGDYLQMTPGFAQYVAENK